MNRTISSIRTGVAAGGLSTNHSERISKQSWIPSPVLIRSIGRPSGISMTRRATTV